MKRNPAAATDLARLLTVIAAVPLSLAALHEEVGAQSDLLLNLPANIMRLGLRHDALALVQEADRVIAALAARADRSAATLDKALAALQALRDKQPQSAPTGKNELPLPYHSGLQHALSRELCYIIQYGL